MAVEVKRTTEVRISGKDLKPLVLMAEVVQEMILEGKEAWGPCARKAVRDLAEFLIALGCRFEEG